MLLRLQGKAVLLDREPAFNSAVAAHTEVEIDRRLRQCIKACPMGIPLTRAIYEENRETVVHGLFGWLKR